MSNPYTIEDFEKERARKMKAIDEKHEAKASVTTMAIALLLFIPMMLPDAWVISVLWRWFAVTTFHLPPLSITTAAGLACLHGVFRTPMAPNDRSYWEMIFHEFLRLGLYLAAGAFFHWVQ